MSIHKIRGPGWHFESAGFEVAVVDILGEIVDGWDSSCELSSWDQVGCKCLVRKLTCLELLSHELLSLSVDAVFALILEVAQ